MQLPDESEGLRWLQFALALINGVHDERLLCLDALSVLPVTRLTFRLVFIFTHSFIPQSSCNCGEITKESHISESYLCNNDARLTSGLPFGEPTST